MWKRLFRQPLPLLLPHLSLPLPPLPLPTELGLYLIYKLADKHDYQNQQLKIYKGTFLVKMIAKSSICQYGSATLLNGVASPKL